MTASPSHRQNCSKTLILNEQVCARLKSDPTLRVLLFSALEQPLTRDTPIDIAFPSQIEVRLNGEEVKANYKGLKNKPGSTRPADITHLVRTSPANHRNTLVVTYALTQKASRKKCPIALTPCYFMLTFFKEIYPICLPGEEVLRRGIDNANHSSKRHHEAVCTE